MTTTYWNISPSLNRLGLIRQPFSPNSISLFFYSKNFAAKIGTALFIENSVDNDGELHFIIMLSYFGQNLKPQLTPTLLLICNTCLPACRSVSDLVS